MTASTQADILALFDRLLPEGYLTPLKSPGPGYELLQAFASVAARISTAVESLETDAYMMSATGGKRAQVSIEFYRPAGAATPAVTIKAGTVVCAGAVPSAPPTDPPTWRPSGSRRFTTDEDIVFTLHDHGPHTTRATAFDESPQYNVPGPFTAASGDAVEGDMATGDVVTTRSIQLLIEDPVFADPYVMVRQRLTASGGRSASLDALGGDRGLPRLSGESDDAYRTRIRQLPETVTPNAVLSFINRVFAPWGCGAVYVEPFDHFTGVWNAPETDIAAPGGIGLPVVVRGMFNWNDTRTVSPDAQTADPRFYGRWLDAATERGCFIITVPALPALNDFGGAWNDPAMGVAGVLSPGGVGMRALAAWNTPLDPTGTLGVPWAWNGPDVALAAIYKGLYDGIQAVKAAGVNVVVWLQGQ